MSSVCLSLVANLRCSGLLPPQAIGILIPPILEAILTSFLLYTQRGKERKHFLLVFESNIYLILCVLDYISKAVDSIARSLRSFSILDRLIGGLSAFPIILFTLFLYIFARQHLIPIVPTRFHSGLKVLYLLLIPILLTLVELGSFLGISYGRLSSPSKELAIKFDTPLSKTVWTLFNSAGLAIFILYHLLTFLLSCFRIFRHFLQSSDNTSSNSRGRGRDQAEKKRKSSKVKGTRDGKKTLKGLGWFAAGVKLSAFEVLLGYIPNGFEMSLARRLLRLLGRAMIAWGLQKGLDETASLVLFRIGSIDSIEGLPPRRIPIHTDRSIRELIGAPIVTTFSHMSPTATAFHTRKNAPDAMKAISQYDRSFFSSDEKPRPGPSGLKNLNSNLNSNGSGSFEEKETVQSAIVPALVIQGVGAPATNNATYPNQVTNTTTTTIPQRYTPSPPNNRNFKNDTFTPTPSTSTPGPGQDQDQGPGQDQDYQRGKRVTLAYDGLAAPVLDIRFSSQAFAFADANVLIKRLGSKHSPSGSTDGSGHVHSHGHGHLAPIAEQRTGISRSKTFVGNVAATTTSSSGGGTGTGSGSSPFADPPLPRGRSRSLSQKSTVPPELNNPFADSYEVLLSPDGVLGSSQESSSYFSSMGRNGEPGKLTRKRTLSGSSEDEGEEGSLRAIHKLSKKFPSLPPGVASVRPEELFANANASAPRPRPRSKSMNNMGRRKPPPQLLTDLEEEAKSVTLVTQQQQQQPTPVRARMTKPRPRSKSQPPVPDQTVLKRNAGVYDDGEYEIAGGDSPRRFAGQLSPTTSLDQDIAMRTRRRIRNHLSTITPTSSSVRSSAAGGDDEQWATVPQPFTPSSVLALARQEPQKSNGSLRNRPGITTGTATATASPSSLFSSPNPLPRGRETSRGYGSGPRRRNTGETIDSPFTVYTRESEYSVQMEEDVEFSPPLLVDRPMGRIARRALGIEQFLGEEKEKWEASQDGHDPTTTTTTATTTTTMTAGAAMAVPHPYAAVVAPGTVSAGAAAAGSSRGLNVPEDVTDIADYRASNIVLSPPNTSRRRPRSDVDTLRNPIPFVFASSGRERMPRSKNNNVRSNTSIGIQEIGNVPITPSSTATTPTSTLKRSVTTVDDPDARRAFAAAWKTVNPNVASPTIAGLKNVASVSVKRTPPPVTHRKVLSGHSISADEGNFESVLPVVDESVELPPLLENTAPPLMMTNPMLVRRSLVGTVGTMRTADGEIGFGRMRGSVING